METITSLGWEGFNNQSGSILIHIIPSHLLVHYFIYQIWKEYDKNLLSQNVKQNMKHFYLGGGGVLLGPYIKSMGTGASKCQQMQASSQWRHMCNKGNN